MKSVKLLLFIPIFIACSSHEIRKDNDKLLHVPIMENQIQDSFVFSSIIDDVQFIPLETTDASAIGEVFKIEQVGDRYFILDRFVASTVDAFDKNGKFISQYGKKGYGKGEYVMPMDFVINQRNNNLYILNSERRKVNIYDLSTSTFKDEKPYEFPSLGFSAVGDAFWHLGGSRGDCLIVSDTNFERKASDIPFQQRYGLGLINNMFRISDDTALFRLSHNDTIYKLTPTGFFPYLTIDFGDKKLTDKYYAGLNDAQKARLEEYTVPYMGNLAIYRESPQHIVFAFYYKKNQFLAFHDKSSGRTIVAPRNNLADDITFTGSIPAIFGLDDQGYFLSTVSASKIIKAGEKASDYLQEHGQSVPAQTKERLDQFIKLSNGLTALSNPVLFRFKLKSF